jgi:aryl-alcohol dehydrogenase-like predicted oxidoreductase
MDQLVSDARLALGTVQWGLPYGVANRTGQPGPDEVSAMVSLARSSHIDTLDTARAYGDSEAVIGHVVGADPAFHVVTKTDPNLLEGSGGRDSSLERLHESLGVSRELLDRSRLDTVLLHRPEHRLAHGGALWDALRHERDQDRIGRIGISALTPEDAFAALEEADVTVMQVASSLLDRRLLDAGFFEAAQSRGVEVHVRSVFLQGSAFFSPSNLPDKLAPIEPSIRRLDEAAHQLQVSRPVLFWAWARQLGASKLLVGCERAEQLREQLAWFEEATPHLEAIASIAQELPVLGEEVVDPSRWS